MCTLSPVHMPSLMEARKAPWCVRTAGFHVPTIKRRSKAKLGAQLVRSGQQAAPTPNTRIGRAECWGGSMCGKRWALRRPTPMTGIWPSAWPRPPAWWAKSQSSTRQQTRERRMCRVGALHPMRGGRKRVPRVPLSASSSGRTGCMGPCVPQGTIKSFSVPGVGTHRRTVGLQGRGCSSHVVKLLQSTLFNLGCRCS